MTLSMPTRRLVSQEDAAMVARADIPRSRFLNEYSRLATYQAGILYPFLCEETLPGDVIKYDVTAYIRVNTLLFPMFSSLRVDTHVFYVPNRVVWPDFQRFMGQQASPGQSVDILPPQVESNGNGFERFRMGDHFGLPVVGQVANKLRVNAFPFRAYNRIWSDWFRDQDLEASAAIFEDGALRTEADYPLRFRSKAHDQFTSARPFAQKFTAPTVPLGGQAPLKGLGIDLGAPNVTNYTVLDTNQDAVFFQAANYNTNVYFQTAPQNPYADLSAATGVDINTWRTAIQVQSLLEKDARFGTRYVETLEGHFGVAPQDARLQRPEYCGGGSSPIVVHAVAQTAPAGGGVVGSLGAAGTSNGRHTARVVSPEHGFVIGLISVRSELAYQQGIHKQWDRRTRYDYYWPSLALLGEQPIKRREIYAQGTSQDDVVFGYQERWAEYKQMYSTVHAFFRSGLPGTLDAWHLAQNFSSAPVLGPTFIHDEPPMARVLAAGVLANEQQLLADILVRRDKTTAMPMHSTPASLGAF